MDARLVCPITLGTSSDESGATPDVLRAALASSYSVIASSPASVVTGSTPEAIAETICLGCRDGSLFVLKAVASFLPGDQSSNLNEGSFPEFGVSPKTRLSHLPSGASTPSASSKKSYFGHNAPTGLLTSPTRAVSNVNTVQVEAPKASVPHDDEEGKLRAILGQTSQIRDTSSLESILRPLEKSVQIDSDTTSRPLDRQTIKPMKSKLLIQPISDDTPTRASSPSSPASRSRHTSASHPASMPYTLNYHIILSQTGPGQAVAAIEYLNDGSHVLVLQESGSANPSIQI